MISSGVVIEDSRAKLFWVSDGCPDDLERPRVSKVPVGVIRCLNALSAEG